jgi:peptide/nickel transport system substrate-binding protein
VAQLEAIKVATVHFTTQPAWEGIQLNLRDPFLDNVKVRQALAMAIDYQALVSKVWDGHAIEIGADQPPDSYAYNPNLHPYPFNLAKAKQILLSQGFKMGSNGYLEKNGTEFTLVYSTTSGDPWRALDQELIQTWFRAIGVNVVIKDYPANAYFGTVLPSGKGWQMGEFEFAEGYDPLAGMQPMFGTGGVNNYGNFSNPALDKLFTEAANTTSHATEKSLLQQAEVIIHDQVPEIMLYSPKEIDTSIDMTGYQPNPYMVDTWTSYNWANAAE